MNRNIAAQIAGFVDPHTVEQADHAITSEEHDMACDVAYEWATRDGFDLAAAVEQTAQAHRETGHAMGLTDADIDRLWA